MKQSAKSRVTENRRHPLFPSDPVAIVADGEAGSGTAPARPLLIAAWSGDVGRLVSVEELGEFLAAHAKAKIFCHDAASLHWLLFAALSSLGDRQGLEELWRVSAECRLFDAMLLRQLLPFVRAGLFFPPARLSMVLRDVVGGGHHDDFQTIEKWQSQLSNPAEEDHVLRQQASMELAKIVYGVCDALFAEANSFADYSNIGDKEINNKHGPLGLGIDVQAAIALRRVEQSGLFLSRDDQELVRIAAVERYRQASRALNSKPAFRDCFAWDSPQEVGRDGKGFPIVKPKLANCLERCYERIQDVVGCSILRPLAGDGKISPFPAHWGLWLYHNEDLRAWGELMQAAETIRAMQAVSASDCLRPKYEVVPQIASRSPNLPFVRSLGDCVFRPREGCVFIVLKTRDLELRCLAACLQRRAVLHEMLESGKDVAQVLAAAFIEGGLSRTLVHDGRGASDSCTYEQLVDIVDTILTSMMHRLPFSTTVTILNLRGHFRCQANDVQLLCVKAIEAIPELVALFDESLTAARNDGKLPWPITPMGGFGRLAYIPQLMNQTCIKWADELRKVIAYSFVKSKLPLVGVAGSETLLEAPIANAEAIIVLANGLATRAVAPSLGSLGTHCCSCSRRNSW